MSEEVVCGSGIKKSMIWPDRVMDRCGGESSGGPWKRTKVVIITKGRSRRVSAAAEFDSKCASESRY